MLRLMTRIRSHSTFLFYIVMGNVCAVAADVQFDRHVRPILAKNCFHCHGPDEDARETDMRLDREAGFLRPRLPVLDGLLEVTVEVAGTEVAGRPAGFASGAGTGGSSAC